MNVALTGIRNPAISRSLNFNVLITNEEKTWGGAEEYTLSLAKALHQLKINTTLVANRDSVLFERASAVGLPAVSVPMRNEVDLGAVLSIVKILKDKRINLIHMNTMRDHALGTIAAKLAGIKKIVRTQHIHYPENPSIIAQFAYNASTSIICVSHSIKDNMQKHGVPLHKLAIAHSGIDVERFLPHLGDRTLRRDLSIGDEELAIGVVGNFFKNKGHEFFIRAAALLVGSTKKFRFVLAGDGPERKNLESLASNLGLRDLVIFAEFRDDIPRLIAAMDIMVTPSVWEEPLGLVNLEIMLMGKPLVATKVGGIPEIVLDGETGILVPPKDPEGIAEAILRLTHDELLTRKLTAAGSERVKKHFSIEAMAQRILRIYES